MYFTQEDRDIRRILLQALNDSTYAVIVYSSILKHVAYSFQSTHLPLNKLQQFAVKQ